MKFAFIHHAKDHQPGWDVARLCGVLGVSRSGYYDWVRAREAGPSARAVHVETLSRKVREVFDHFGGKYGSPRVWRELKRQGIHCNRKTVATIMQRLGLAAKGKKRFRVRTTDSRHNHRIAPNRLKQDFSADAPNRKWVTDLTYVRTDEGWLYVVTVIDLFSRKVVGWSAADHMEASLCIEALEKAAAARGRHPGLILHSDRGVQFACREFRKTCLRHRIKRSMSAKGDCYDNAVAESFFGTLKTEHLNGQSFRTREQARLEVFAFIEGFYNTRRMHSTLDYLSPDEFEAANVAA